MYLNGQRTEGRKEIGKKESRTGSTQLRDYNEELLERKVAASV
jgi:hypothetical protein